MEGLQQTLITQLAAEIVRLANMDKTELDKVMDTKACAEFLHTNEGEVRRMARAGQLPHIRLGGEGSRLRFHRDAVAKAMGI